LNRYAIKSSGIYRQFHCQFGNDSQVNKHMTGFVADSFCKQHITGRGHPESPARFDAIVRAIEQSGVTSKLDRISGPPADEQLLQLCHSPDYIALAHREIATGEPELSTGDTPISEKSWDAALAVLGHIRAAVDDVVERRVANAFCVVRPPGHHATANRGMGFCIFNNIALAARYAQQQHKIKRVLIIDWDVHHGNGTQDIFYRDGSVFFFSTHQSPWYPGTGAADETGEGAGKGTTLNCPLPAGSGRAEILGAMRARLVPAADQFRPQLVLISAGFDSRIGDPLGLFCLTDEDFIEMTQLVREIAERHAGGRVVSLLEGGYNLDGLASAALAHVQALAS
jgi:acetoin utilization deacetylase AcuC-like enzyme